ncbi:MAG: hypothetical protein ABI604_06060, partial [Nitrospirota bacterium]
ISSDTTSSGNIANSTRHWLTEDGMLSPEYKLIAFTVLEQSNVERTWRGGTGNISHRPAPTWESRATSSQPFRQRRRER